VAVARELTKKFEQVVRGTAAEVFEHFRETPPRGELVILIEGVAGRERVPEEASPEAARKLVKSLVREGLDKKEAMREAARQLGTSRREVYRALLESEGEK
jgi:16S rRNA (cytidine1402-2'-O)-methyltransferase